MAVLPAEIPTGLVQGQFYFVNEDNVDADTDPDLTVVRGAVVFTCSAKKLRMPTKKATVIPLEFKAVFDSQGRLVAPGNTAVGLELPATDSPLFNPTNFTWTVSFDLIQVSNRHTVSIEPFSFQVPEGQTTDLTLVMPVDSSPGVLTIQGPQGIQGIQGIQGVTGAGVPAGGTALQMIRKKADNSTIEWFTADYIPKWLPNTAYVAGARVVAPTGGIVSAKVTFTSGVTYNAANWTPYNRLGVSPLDYGAVGDVVTDVNGTLVSATNDSAAMQAALTAAIDVGVLNLGGRTYYMGSTTLAATLKGPLTIAGNGTLIWDSGNGIQLTQNNADHTVTVNGVTLLTNAPGTGVGLEIIGSGQNTGSGLQPRTKPRGSIDRVDIRGVRDTGISGWGKGIRLVDVMNFIITKVHIDGYQPTQGNFVSTHGIEMVTETAVAKAVDVTITQSYIYLVQYALDVQGYEGVMVDDCSFIGVGTGYRNDAVDAGAPLASFRGGQIAFKNKGIEWNKIHQGVISDALIYTHSTSGTPDTATGVTLTDSTTNRITGCTFVSNNGMQTAVLIQGSLSNSNVVESNTYYSGITNPVVIGTGATLNKVRNLTLRSASQSIINNGGTTNTIELEDTGWITTGLTVTPSTNWTLTSYSIRKARNQVFVRVVATYTGTNVTTGADGNLGDIQAVTIPAEYRPIYSWPLNVGEFATRTWGGFISTVGVLTLSNGLPTQTLTSGNAITFTGTYMAN